MSSFSFVRNTYYEFLGPPDGIALFYCNATQFFNAPLSRPRKTFARRRRFMTFITRLDSPTRLILSSPVLLQHPHISRDLFLFPFRIYNHPWLAVIRSKLFIKRLLCYVIFFETNSILRSIFHVHRRPPLIILHEIIVSLEFKFNISIHVRCRPHDSVSLVELSSSFFPRPVPAVGIIQFKVYHRCLTRLNGFNVR